MLQARDQARDRQPARHRALPGRVLQPRQVDQGRAEGASGGSRPVATSSSWSSSARRDKQLDANDQHIVHIVDWLWQYAFEQRASDIHIEPRREQGIVRFRIDGVLHQVYQIPPAVLAAMTSRIKILGAHGRGGEAPAAGRPHQDAHRRRRGDRAAPLDAADRVRREAGDAHLRPGSAGARLHASSASPTTTRKRWERDDRAAARHRAGHRPDRLGQDHHALLDAEDARHAGGERLHHRGPDRDGRAGVQPDAGAARRSTSTSPRACAR